MDARSNDQIQHPDGTLGNWLAGHKPRFSPINERRWQNFSANRRGYWSLWIFLVLFTGVPAGTVRQTSAPRRWHTSRE